MEVLGAALAGPLASALRAQGLIPSGSAAMGPPFGQPFFGGHPAFLGGHAMGRGFNAPFDPGYGFMSTQTRPQFQGGSDPSSGVGTGNQYHLQNHPGPSSSGLQSQGSPFERLGPPQGAPQPRAQSPPKVGG